MKDGIFLGRRGSAPLALLCLAGTALWGTACDDELGTPESGSLTPTTGGGLADTTAGVTGSPAQSTSDAGTASAVKPSCDVAPIFEAKCQECHGVDPLYGAPMSLVDYADFQGMGPATPEQTLLALIGARIHDAQKPMPPSGNLTEEEKATIDAWLAAGAPSDQGLGCGGSAGETTASTGGATAGATSGEDPYMQAEWPPADADECFELTAHAEGSMDEPHLVLAKTETHPEIVFDAPWGDRVVQAVGFKPITDNAKVLHHWILYENIEPAGAFLVGWAPGNEGRKLPDDVGMYLPSGPQSLYLDMHYYNLLGESDEPDSSGVEICVAYEENMRPNTATVFMDFSNIFGLRIPAQSDTDIVDYCRITGSQTVTTMSVSPHMHELGYHAKLEVQRAESGEVEVWHDKGFDFEDQQIHPLDGKVLHPGDVVKTTCSFRNDTNNEVTFGEDTGDEMCFNFVTYYPKGGLRCDPLYPSFLDPNPF